jgi:hypothetical protein
MMKRSALFSLLVGSTTILAASALAQTSQTADAPAAQSQSGPADLCRELLAYAEMKAKEPPKPAQSQASAPADAPMPRADGQATGTQGGGSVGPSTSTDTSSQGGSAPTTAPVASGAAPEAASSPHATGGSAAGSGATPAGAGTPPEEVKLAADITVQQVRDIAGRGDREACRDTAQTLRRAGADMPAALIALAAYEPDPAKRR